MSLSRFVPSRIKLIGFVKWILRKLSLTYWKLDEKFSIAKWFIERHFQIQADFDIVLEQSRSTLYHLKLEFVSFCDGWRGGGSVRARENENSFTPQEMLNDALWWWATSFENFFCFLDSRPAENVSNWYMYRRWNPEIVYLWFYREKKTMVILDLQIRLKWAENSVLFGGNVFLNLCLKFMCIVLVFKNSTSSFSFFRFIQ